MDGDGNAVGSESFACSTEDGVWRYVAKIETTDPFPHDESVELVVDRAWRPLRLHVETGTHELELATADGALRGHRDGASLELDLTCDQQVDYLTPSANAVTARWLAQRSAEIDVWYFDAVTLEPTLERQRYGFLGVEDVRTAAAPFRNAERWRYTALPSGWTRDLWVVDDVVVAYDGLFTLASFASG
jgi:hypothetical protein